MFDSMVRDEIGLDEAAQKMFKQQMYHDVSFLEHLYSMCSAKKTFPVLFLSSCAQVVWLDKFSRGFS